MISFWEVRDALAWADGSYADIEDAVATLPPHHEVVDVGTNTRVIIGNADRSEMQGPIMIAVRWECQPLPLGHHSFSSWPSAACFRPNSASQYQGVDLLAELAACGCHG